MTDGSPYRVNDGFRLYNPSQPLLGRFLGCPRRVPSYHNVKSPLARLKRSDVNADPSQAFFMENARGERSRSRSRDEGSKLLGSKLRSWIFYGPSQRPSSLSTNSLWRLKRCSILMRPIKSRASNARSIGRHECVIAARVKYQFRDRNWYFSDGKTLSLFPSPPPSPAVYGKMEISFNSPHRDDVVLPKWLRNVSVMHGRREMTFFAVSRFHGVKDEMARPRALARNKMVITRWKRLASDAAAPVTFRAYLRVRRAAGGTSGGGNIVPRVRLPRH